LLIAAVFGAAVGYERRSSDKPAGLRTLSLVAVDSALFTIISTFIFEAADQSRVAAQIVTGVGFLGGGTILRSEGSISGLTTSATIWATAAIGMAVGSGLYIAASGGTVLMLAILYILAPSRNSED
jgi:putative Mg2+ transporter-C (MgtC) family protein